jgi:hypothetical protein
MFWFIGAWSNSLDRIALGCRCDVAECPVGVPHHPCSTSSSLRAGMAALCIIQVYMQINAEYAGIYEEIPVHTHFCAD